MCRTRCVLVLVALCVGLTHSWDFAVSTGDDQLSLYTNEVITSIITIKSRNLTALAYDEVHNMMLYVDKQTGGDIICGYDFTATENKCFTERNGRHIHGLAYDPVTELVFFTDTYERSVKWISLKPGSKNNVNGTILLDDGIPRAIVVDSCKGYIYWLTTNMAIPAIERARMNGTEREVVEVVTSIPANKNYYLQPHSLAIDQQTQSIYWMEPHTTTLYHLYAAELNRKHKTLVVNYGPISDPAFISPLNTLTVSKNYVVLMDFINKVRKIHKFPKNFSIVKTGSMAHEKMIPIYIVANYKIKDQVKGIQHCDALSRVKNAMENSCGSFCVHGLKVNEQSICKCTPGYTGERCDVSICENYCLQGNCSLNDAALPECRCNAGYSGDKCEVYECHGHCLNNGDCSLNEKGEPICHCKGDYVGHRCEISGCENYCLQGSCSLNETGLPECRCNAGYSGARCEVDACHGHCLNNGNCYLNEEEEPSCQCVDSYEGTRCEADTNNTSSTIPAYCSQERNLTLADLLRSLRKPASEILVN